MELILKLMKKYKSFIAYAVFGVFTTAEGAERAVSVLKNQCIKVFTARNV